MVFGRVIILRYHGLPYFSHSRVSLFHLCGLKTTLHNLGDIYINIKIVCVSLVCVDWKQHLDYYSWSLAGEDGKSVDLDLEVSSLSRYIMQCFFSCVEGGMGGIFNFWSWSNVRARCSMVGFRFGSSWYWYRFQIPSGPFIPVLNKLVPVPWSNIWARCLVPRISNFFWEWMI